jgi:hypothetical protein
MDDPAATATAAGEREADGDTAPTVVAQHLLLATKLGDDPDPHLDRLAAVDDDALERVRTDRRAALAFWSNLYNAGTQLLLSRRPELYGSPLRFVRFFGATAVTVAGTDLSLDDIENNILRAGRSKYTLGYTRKLRLGAFSRRYRLDEPDPRIHFALNCGAASCPAVRFYEPDDVDDQLDSATALYLERTVEYDPDADVARVPRVCLWFRGDFGGGDGIREFLRRYDAIPADATPKIRYLSWDWSRAGGKFAE